MKFEDAFTLFDRRWAIVTAGSVERFNSCTVSWGSLGNIWGRGGESRRIVTVYVHPARYTCKFLQSSRYFTVGFYPEALRPALRYMGSHSGRDSDKARLAGLTPTAIGSSVTYTEAEVTLLCRKLCQQQFPKEALAPEIQDDHAAAPKSFPDGKGGWQPHWMFMGQVLEIQVHT